jgi:DNA-binding MarR family transcriptional regulator
MASANRKAELANELMMAGRDMGTLAIVFHQTVADRLGLNPTDHKCLDLLHRHENATAGDLAEWTGLTTGAVTGIIDRLEKHGFVRRQAHPHDRRKIIVQAVSERMPEVAALFTSLAKGMQEICTHYTQAELQVILDYFHRSAELFRRETQRLQ